MADLTVLSPQPLIILSVSNVSNVSGRFSNGASLHIHSDFDMSASGPVFHVSDDPPMDPTLLSPPRKSFRSRNSQSRHRPPPTTTEEKNDTSGGLVEGESDADVDDQTSYTHSFRPFSYPSSPNLALITPRYQKDLKRPPPPLFRPKTFWRHTRRSAVTGPAYSPASYIVRRSTFVAAGLTLDTPHADLSALAVELRTLPTLEVIARRDSSLRYDVGPVTAFGKRQDPPSPFFTAPSAVTSTSSSSFDYWWPYPPASTTNAFTSASVSPSGGDDYATSDLAPYIFASLTSTLLPAYASAISSSDPSATVDANLTSSNSYSIITITALPPLNTTSVNPHRSHAVSGHHGPLHVVVLAPIFAIIGAALGAAFGWWTYGLYRKYKTLRKDTLGGPRYRGVNHNEDSDEKDGTIIQLDAAAEPDYFNESKSFIGHTSSRRTPFTGHFRDGSQDDHEPLVTGAKNRTPHFNLSILKSPLLFSLADKWSKEENTEHVKVYERLEKSMHYPTDVDGRDGSTHPDFSVASPAHEICTSPCAPTLFGSVATSDEDEDYEAARRTVVSQQGTGTMRYKSIHNRLLEKLQFFGSKRSVSRRTTQERGRTPEMEEGILLQSDAESVKDASSDLTRTKISCAHGRYSHGRAISDFTLAGVDIQPPAATYVRDSQQTPSKGIGGNVLNVVRSYASPLRPSESNDKFTELPKRSKTGRKLKSSRRHRKNLRPGSEEKTKGLEQKENRFFLPASPPTVTSPQLESELFFSPTPPAADAFASVSSRQRVRDLRGSSESPSSLGLYGERAQSHDGVSRPRQMIKEPSGLASYREKALPPSPPRRASRRCSSNSPAKHKSRALLKQRERSGTVPSRPMSPLQRYEARHTAHGRVGAIVSQSWSSRNMRGIPAPSSPTMFGAQVDEGRFEGQSVNSDLRMLSIEQIMDG